MTTSVRITVPNQEDEPEDRKFKVFVSSLYKSDPSGRPELQEFLPGDDVVLHIWDDKAMFICEVPLSTDINLVKTQTEV